MRKNILSVTLILTILLFIPVIANAETAKSGECGSKGGNVTWEFDSDGILTISGDGEMNYMWSYDEIPWYGYKPNIKKVIIEDGVTSISQCAFQDCTGLTDISVPDSITSIGDCAFENCHLLSDIYIPENVCFIGEWAFAQCYSLKKVIIPDAVTWLEPSVFENCTSLCEVIIPNTVTYIAPKVFNGCTSLEKLSLPTGIEYIDLSFIDYDSLKSIYIPKSIKHISYHVLSSLALTDIYYEGTEEDWEKIDIVLLPDETIYAQIHYNIIPEILDKTKITPSGNSYTFDIKLDNVKCSGRLITVLYNGGALSGFKTDFILPDDTEKVVTIDSDDKATSAKIFIWDSMIGMKPLCELASIEEKDFITE
ncbi:MAG: leucine-rich repeat domain-containing protein [Oscillospiraceae bacterium]|nr:leucine-rich repeat domain-containing protein [Oscillospiraceae bacterium]